MKTKDYLSQTERRFLITFALITAVFAFVNFGSFTAERFNQTVEEEQAELRDKANDDYIYFCALSAPDYRPFYRFSFVFFTLFIFLILWARKYFISTFFTLLHFLIIIFWIIETNKLIGNDKHYMPGIPRWLKIAGFADYFLFLSVSILLFWQFSILFRILIKRLQRKSELP
jgi:hypothetical protein